MPSSKRRSKKRSYRGATSKKSSIKRSKNSYRAATRHSKRLSPLYRALGDDSSGDTTREPEENTLARDSFLEALTLSPTIKSAIESPTIKSAIEYRHISLRPAQYAKEFFEIEGMYMRRLYSDFHGKGGHYGTLYLGSDGFLYISYEGDGTNEFHVVPFVPDKTVIDNPMTEYDFITATKNPDGTFKVLDQRGYAIEVRELHFQLYKERLEKEQDRREKRDKLMKTDPSLVETPWGRETS